MTIVLAFEQDLDAGTYKKVLRFVGARNVVPLDELPMTYANQRVVLDKDGDGGIAFVVGDKKTSLIPGDIVTPEKAAEFNKLAEEAAKSLDKVMAELRKNQKNWVGHQKQYVVGKKPLWKRILLFWQ